MEAWWMIQMGMQRTVVTEQENAIRRLDKVGLLMEGSFSEPVSVNGIGLRESVFALFFGFFGLDLTQALAFSWLIYGQILLQGLVGGVVYATRRESMRQPPSENAE
jgi:hypothetical protein